MRARFAPLLLAGLCLLPLPQGAAATPPDAATLQRGVAALLTDPAAHAPFAAALGLPPAPLMAPDPPAPPFPDGPAPVLQTGRLQLALSQLAIHAGTNGHIALIRAQTGRDDALFLQSGFTDLPTLARLAIGSGLHGLAVDGRTVTLTRPLVIWQGAGLRLGPDDRLVLSGPDGAFLLGFGRLDSAGATIDTTGDSPFRPFLLTAGQGTLRVQGGTIRGLGFARSDTFGGIAVLARGLFPPDHPPIIRDVTFHDTGLVFLAGSEGARITGNRFLSPRTGGLTLSATRGALVTGNLIHDARGTAALRLRDGATDTRLSGNIIVNSARSGILAEGNLRRLTLAANAIAGSGGVGLLLRRADCTLLSGNLIAANGAAGIKLQETARTRLSRNALLLNGGSGIALQAQAPSSRTDLSGNLLSGNRDGLSGAGLGPVTLSGDDLTGQLPRLFSGEFAQHLPAYLRARDREGLTAFAIAASADPDAAPADAAEPCTETTGAD